MTVNELIKKLQSLVLEECPIADLGSKEVVIPFIKYDAFTTENEICLTVLKVESELGKMFKPITTQDIIDEFQVKESNNDSL